MHCNFSSLERVCSEFLQITTKKFNKNKHEDSQENGAPTDSLRDLTSCLSIRKDSLASNIIAYCIVKKDLTEAYRIQLFVYSFTLSFGNIPESRLVHNTGTFTLAVNKFRGVRL